MLDGNSVETLHRVKLLNYTQREDYITFASMFTFQFYFYSKGRVHKKNPEKMWSFAKLPSDTPQFGIFSKKKFTPIFLLKIASLMAETNFTLGPTSKTNKFHLLFLVIVGQNSQHKRANLKQFLKLDIYSNNFRPSVKHVLGVLE